MRKFGKELSALGGSVNSLGKELTAQAVAKGAPLAKHEGDEGPPKEVVMGAYTCSRCM